MALAEAKASGTLQYLTQSIVPRTQPLTLLFDSEQYQQIHFNSLLLILLSLTYRKILILLLGRV